MNNKLLSLLFLAIVAIALISVKGASAADAIVVDTDSVFRYLDNDTWGFTGNGYILAQGARSDLDGDGSIATPGEVLGVGYNLSNYTWARGMMVTLYQGSDGKVSFSFRNDLNHEYCMANNASENGHCQQANPQSLANMKTMYDWMDTLNGSVSITLSMLHSRYDDGNNESDLCKTWGFDGVAGHYGSYGLNCPPKSYSYRASTLISAMKLAGICPTWCVGDPERQLTISEWNEPYNVQYWDNNLTSRTGNGSAGAINNCTVATVDFNNFIERDYAALETARVREGYKWNYSTPSWPSRTSAGSFNVCGITMQDSFNTRFSPSTNGSLSWEYYESHPYSRNDANGVYTKNVQYYMEIEQYAKAYGYTKGIATETAENGKTTGFHTGAGDAFAANDTYLNNSYLATAVVVAQSDFWKRVNYFTQSHGYDCSNIDDSNPEFDRCHYMISERETARGAYYAYQGIVHCMEGGSAIYATTNTTGVYGSLARLRNGTYCLSTGYAKATGTSAINVTFSGTGLNVTKLINLQNATQITVTNNFANLGTYKPGTIGMYYLEATSSTPETCSDGIQNQDETGIDTGGVCGGGGGGGSYNGTMPITIASKILLIGTRLILG